MKQDQASIRTTSYESWSDIPTLRAEIRANLPEVAREILTWRRTGILPDGKFRKAAERLNRLYPNDYLAVAEHVATGVALEECARDGAPS